MFAKIKKHLTMKNKFNFTYYFNIRFNFNFVL